MKALYIEDGFDLPMRKTLKREAKEAHGCSKFKSISLTHGKKKLIPGTIENEVASADVIYFDYGGLYLGTSCGIDYWNRFFIQLIEKYPNKKWFCWSALETFEQEDREFLESLGVVFEY